MNTRLEKLNTETTEIKRKNIVPVNKILAIRINLTFDKTE